MLNKKRIALFISAIMASNVAVSSDLEEIASISINNDYRVEQLHNTFLQSIEKQNEIKGTNAFQIQLESNTGYSISDTKNNYSEYDNITSQNGIGFNYALFNPEIESLEKLQNYSSAIALLDFEAYKQEVIFTISSFYYSVLKNQKILDADVEQQKSIQKQYEKINNMFNVGLKTSIDVAEVKAELDQANANILISQNNLENSLSQLYTFTGQNGLKPVDVKVEDKIKHFETIGFEAWLLLLQENNFEIKKAKFSKESAKESIQMASTGNDFSVTLSGGIYNTYNHHASDQFENGGNVNVNIALPLFDGGVTNSQVNQATIDYTNANLDLSYVNRQLKPKLEIVLNELKSIDRQIDAMKEVVKSTKLSKEAIEHSYSVGVRDIVDVLDATTDYYISLKNLTNTEYEYLHKQNELLYLTGTLTLEKL